MSSYFNLLSMCKRCQVKARLNLDLESLNKYGFPEREAIGHVIAYRGHLLEAQLSSGTVNARLAALKSFVTHAAKRKLCAFMLDDSKSVKAQTYKDTRGISIDRFQLLIDGIDRSTIMGKRDYAMVRLLWDNALRRAEVCGLDRR